MITNIIRQTNIFNIIYKSIDIGMLLERKRALDGKETNIIIIQFYLNIIEDAIIHFLLATNKD
jgi:hypothetical protein